MSKYSGFIFVFTEGKRSESIKERIEAGDSYFTDAVSGSDWKPKETEICFVSFDGETIFCGALARRGRKVVTGKYSVKFSDFVLISPLSFDELRKSLGNRLQQHFVYSASGRGGRVPPATWDALWDAIKRLRPGFSSQIERLDGMRRLTRRVFHEHSYDIVAQEKDAVGLALDIFYGEQGRKRILSSWTETTGNLVPPYLRGIEQSQVLEDVMINHDSGVLGEGWDIVARYKVGGITFAKRNELLTVHNVNRTPIEKTLGVDLLYYNWRYNSWVMVQYKRMLQESGNDVLYRANDSSYEAELKRMCDFQLQHSEDFGEDEDQRDFANGLLDFRLHCGPFYFKLCSSVVFEPLSGGLLQGMYLPLDYWRILANSEQGRGPRGGLAIGYKNVGRYLDNKLFIDLVKSGWIGSRLAYSDTVGKLVHDWVDRSQQQSHSSLLAISEPKKDFDPEDYISEDMIGEQDLPDIAW